MPSDAAKGLALMRDAGFRSKYAQLKGTEALAFGAMRTLYEARVALVFVALGSFVLATGGRGIPGIGGGGGGGSQYPDYTDEAADDEFDDFD